MKWALKVRLSRQNGDTYNLYIPDSLAGQLVSIVDDGTVPQGEFI